MARRVNGGIKLGFEADGYFDEVAGFKGIPSSSFLSPPPSEHIDVNSSPSSAVSVTGGGLSNIVHRVSKFDTLAGVAIKYGVEVADIRKINGLVSDVQMFAMKTLQIPLPGRHPPSPLQSSSFDAQGESSSEATPSRHRHSDLFDTFQSLKLKPSSQQDVSLSRGTFHGPLAKPSIPKSPCGLHRKCKSEANGFMYGDDDDLSGKESTKGSRDDDSDKLMKRLHVRRRQKSEADFSNLLPQMSAKEENIGEGSFSSTVYKCSGLRPNQLLAGEEAQPNPTLISLGDSFIATVVNGIRKSSSTSSLQESDNGTLFSLWSTSRWNLKPDLNVLSTAGIPNPISGRKNKAAVD